MSSRSCGMSRSSAALAPRANPRGVWADRVAAARASMTRVSGLGSTSGRSGSARRPSVGAIRRATAASRWLRLGVVHAGGERRDQQRGQHHRARYGRRSRKPIRSPASRITASSSASCGAPMRGAGSGTRSSSSASAAGPTSAAPPDTGKCQIAQEVVGNLDADHVAQRFVPRREHRGLAQRFLRTRHGDHEFVEVGMHERREVHDVCRRNGTHISALNDKYLAIADQPRRSGRRRCCRVLRLIPPPLYFR